MLIKLTAQLLNAVIWNNEKDAKQFCWLNSDDGCVNEQRKQSHKDVAPFIPRL